MVDSVSRSVRDGVLPGEFAPALMLLNRSTFPHCARALLLHLLGSLSSSVAAGTAQPGCIVLVAAERDPAYYQSFEGFKEEQILRFRFVDCFVDPLGWRKLLSKQHLLEEVKECTHYKVCHDLRDLDSLLSLILQSGTFGKSETVRFSIVIDSINSLLAYNSLDSVAKFLNDLRSNGMVSSLIWMLHSDLFDGKAIKTLEYISSMIIFMEQLGTAVIRKADESLQNASNKSFSEGMLKVRQKRRNGRVREQIEKFEVDGLLISISNKVEEGAEAGKISVPQVQFRLQLSDKERQERAKVILPFEHQGNGRESYIYNGRPETMATPLSFENTEKDLQKLSVGENFPGQVEYLRDSDDERPDSDEDPDDDLDI